MRILLLTQLFDPEPNFLKGLRFARSLVERGHSVQVLTGFPNYPEGRIYEGYRLRLCSGETMDGVEVLRIPHFPSHDASAVNRILSYLSFALSAGFFGVLRVRRPDVIHVYQGPATLMIPARVIARLRGASVVLDIQDLWPESVTGSGMLHGGALVKVLDAFCRWTYAKADRIVVLSDGFKQRLIDRGVPADRIEVVYNWCDEWPAHVQECLQQEVRAEGLDPHCFNVVYAGSFGPLQNLDTVLDAAQLLSGTDSRARFVLVGDGIEAAALRARAASLALSNVAFVPRRPPGQIRQMYAHAQALLVHLKDHPLSVGAIPQKVQAYLAAGRPIVIGANGEAAALVETAGAGVTCRAGSPEDLARAVRRLECLSEQQRDEMGRRGAAYYRQHLSFAKGCNRMDSIFRMAVSETVA